MNAPVGIGTESQPLAAPADGLLAASLATARTLAFQQGRPLMGVLQEVLALENGPFLEALALAFGYTPFPMVRLQAGAPDFDRIGFAEASQRGLLVMAEADGTRWLVLSDPFDGDGEAWGLQRVDSGVRVALSHPADFRALLSQLEERLSAMRDILGDGESAGESERMADLSLASIHEDDSPVIKLVNSTLYDALRLQASDIHLEVGEGGLTIKYRIDGVLVPVGEVPGGALAEQVISRVKVLADLDIAERRIPQDGRFKVRIAGREVDFRVSVMPNLFGEDAVLRLLDRRSLATANLALRLESLGLDAEAMASIRLLATKPHGMLLVTGPTGSGKTTTLYAALSEINDGQDKIITIEDPVEYRLNGVLQIPVNERTGLTFARGLRSILRHDPDKIMVGEIRDEETAQIAVQAALTGHLVFTTVHANNVFDVLGRFTHMGVDPYSFSAALNGIVAQRLVRMNCRHCSDVDEPDPVALARLEVSLEQSAGWSFKRGRGCGECRGTGYKGRRAAAEVLVLNDRLRELIATRATAAALKEVARGAGLRPLRETVLDWVASGDTSLAEVLRVAG